MPAAAEKATDAAAIDALSFLGSSLLMYSYACKHAQMRQDTCGSCMHASVDQCLHAHMNVYNDTARNQHTRSHLHAAALHQHSDKHLTIPRRQLNRRRKLENAPKSANTEDKVEFAAATAVPTAAMARMTKSGRI